eukprot:9035331-Lingulodinium_polyedra.AAC.1
MGRCWTCARRSVVTTRNAILRGRITAGTDAATMVAPATRTAVCKPANIPHGCRLLMRLAYTSGRSLPRTQCQCTNRANRSA